jgi:hypothetical protein
MPLILDSGAHDSADAPAGDRKPRGQGVIAGFRRRLAYTFTLKLLLSAPITDSVAKQSATIFSLSLRERAGVRAKQRKTGPHPVLLPQGEGT